MSPIVLTRRDIDFLKYLHSCKVATTKQINRDVFKSGHRTCHFRVKKFLQRKFISKIPSDWEIDKSFVFSLTSRGMKVVTANFKGLIDSKRFRSNSISHDLKLVNMRNFFLNLEMVKGYFTENQIQTYSLFNSQDEIATFKEMRVDAMMLVHSQGKARLSIPLELEISTKSTSEYQKKIREIYYHKGITFLFYVCDSKESEIKIKKIEKEFVTDQRKKIFYITYNELLSSKEVVTFINQDNDSFKLN